MYYCSYYHNNFIPFEITFWSLLGLFKYLLVSKKIEKKNLNNNLIKSRFSYYNNIYVDITLLKTVTKMEIKTIKFTS